MPSYLPPTLYLNPLEDDQNKMEENTEIVHEKNAQVWMLLSGEPPLDYVQDQITSVNNYNSNHTKQIIGISFDTEPWSQYTEQNTSDRKEMWEDYLDEMEEFATHIHEHNLSISIIIPFWLDRISEAYPNNRPINYDVIDIADEVIVMAYTIFPERIDSYTHSSITYAQEHNKTVKIAIEMTQQPEANISFYDNPEGIKSIINTPIDSPAFGGYVIHTLDAFDQSNILLDNTNLGFLYPIYTILLNPNKTK
jgi:hypothetical protein